jgi:predicted nucleic acid-binding protein
VFVLDCSVTMAWIFDDEDDPLAAAVRDRLGGDVALAPSIWPLEVGNALLVAERRQRVSRAEALRFLEVLRQLPIDVDATEAMVAMDRVLQIAREAGLSAYDASYLELAARFGLPLATLDRRLASAAVRVGVALCE